MAVVVCFIPCCARKASTGRVLRPPYNWPTGELPDTWPMLEAGRRGMEWCLERGSRETAALHLYAGNFYNIPGIKDEAEQLIRSGRLRLFIISAGYGVLDALEPALKYEAKMEGKVAAHWRDAGLVEVIAEICLTLNPEQVYGFFPGEPAWAGAGAKYRYFFTAGVQKALRTGLDATRAGCFYRVTGTGASAILQALGRCFFEFMASGFPDSFVEAARTAGCRYEGVVVGYEEITAGAKPERGLKRPVEAFTSSPGELAVMVSREAGAEATGGEIPGAREMAPETGRVVGAPTAQDFQRALHGIFKGASGDFVDVRSGDLHRRVGGYPGTNHRMPVCCEVMRRNMRPGDKVINQPPGGRGASLVIRYRLPR